MVEGNNDSIPEENARLVAACLAGDESAWTALVSRYHPLVVRLARTTGLSGADIEDVFQNVCLKMWLHLKGLRETEKLTAWVAAVTRQECFRIVRRPLEQPLDSVELSTTDSTPIETALIEAEQRELVRLGVEQLSPRCRELLNLLYGEDRASYVEVSERMNIPQGSIGPRRARCLDYLRKRMRSFTD